MHARPKVLLTNDCNELKCIGIDNAEEARGDIADIIENMAFMASKSVMLGPLEEI
jgi:hypothetical protein